MSKDQTILICQGRCCRKYDSKEVLTAFESQVSQGITIIPCGCLGKCGNGTTVLVLPQKIYYPQVQVEDVPLIYQLTINH